MIESERARLPGLEGIRGIAALYVVLHHCYLQSFPGFPANTGSPWTGWLLYGHFAVVLFIVLSGFSLAVSPSRNGWQLGGGRLFAQRRAWRVLPAYWAALIVSLVIASVVPVPGEGVPTAKSIWVYGLLLQDIFGAPSPNGALWSIAVEVQLYALFPFLLLMIRRAGPALMIASVCLPVLLIGWFAPTVPWVHMLVRLSPPFAVLFAVGVAAARLIEKQDRPPCLPWLAVIAGAIPAGIIVYAGSEWTMRNLYWIDIALGPASALLLAYVVHGRPKFVVAALESRPIRSLGAFSYSLYLIHAPIVILLHRVLVAPVAESGPRAFTLMVLLAVPVCLVAAKGLATVFEIPFQRRRGWPLFREIRRGFSGTNVQASRIDVGTSPHGTMGAGDTADKPELLRN